MSPWVQRPTRLWQQPRNDRNKPEFRYPKPKRQLCARSGHLRDCAEIRFAGSAQRRNAKQASAYGLGTGRWRSDAAILAWFGDWELIAPGLVPLWDWRPDKETDLPEDAIYQGFVGGVARKA